MLDVIQNTMFRYVFKAILALKPAPKPLVFDSESATEALINHISEQKLQRVLLMTSSDLVQLKLLDPCLAHLDHKGIQYQIFDQVEPNPSFTTVKSAIELYHAENCDAVLAFGGGSVIDASKATALQIGNKVPLEKLMGLVHAFRARHKAVPFFAIPTTAGTGSEVTSNAVLSDPETHQKAFITDHKTIPLAVALDANTMLGLPNFITADTGMDVLTHAIEAYVSKMGTPEMMDAAVDAVRLVFENLPEAYANGSHYEARANMSKASFKAGMAFNNMGLGFVHAISHQLTAFYGTPHGRANAITLPRVLKASMPALAPELASLARKAGIAQGESDDLSAAQDFIEKVIALSEQVNIPAGIAELDSKDFDAIAKNARLEAIWTYPIRHMLSHKTCRDILEEIKAQAA